ncbi:MAG: tagaturonate epimerase family protein [bacterium]
MDDAKLRSFYGKDEAKRPPKRERQRIAKAVEKLLPEGKVYPDSVCKVPDGLLAMCRVGDEDRLAVFCPRRGEPRWSGGFEGEAWGVADTHRLALVPRTANNVWVLRDVVDYVNPRPLGTKSSFGFGDRTGLATPGHVMAALDAGDKIAPIFPQQSVREMTRTNRTPKQVMVDAVWGVFRAGYDRPFGADADHLKAPEDVNVMAAAGFCFFTIDPSDHVDQKADDYSVPEVRSAFEKLIADKVPGVEDMLKLYGGRAFEIDGDGGKYTVDVVGLALQRCAVKYGRALAHVCDMAEHIRGVMGGRPFELEMSVDETAQPTSPVEHLVIGLELKRRGVEIVSLAPRFIGEFEKGIDYKGDLAEFEKSLKLHAAIARHAGPYKISVHSGSDKFAVYPIVGRVCGSFHVKTAGTSYLEALRVAARVDKDLFREIAAFSRERFPEDRATYHISAELDHVMPPERLANADLEPRYLVNDSGRQILHVTFGSVLTARADDGSYLFRDRLLELLKKNDELHCECLRTHLGKHLEKLLEKR